MKKSLKLAFIGVGLIAAGLAVFLNAGEQGSLEKVKNFRVYYGKSNNRIVQDMRNYDLVIVEALQFDGQDIETIKENETKVAGYLSVVEIGNWDREIRSRLNSSDFLIIDEKKTFAKDYGNYLGDISQAHFREILLEVLEKRIVAKGMDGVFLDTTDWLDYYETQEDVHRKLIRGYQEFLSTIRQRFPGIFIIQNRGFASLEKMSSDYVDGIVWENFDVGLIEYAARKKRVEKLDKLRREKKIAVFTISYGNEQANRAFAREMGWIHLQQREKYRQWTFGQ